MAGIARFMMMAEFLTSARARHRVPEEGMLELVQEVDEIALYVPLRLANNAIDVAVPGIGASASEITTVRLFALFAYGVMTVKWAAGGATVLNGTVARPDVFLVKGTAVTTVPTLSNTSGAAVDCDIFIGGT